MSEVAPTGHGGIRLRKGGDSVGSKPEAETTGVEYSLFRTKFELAPE